MTPGRIPALALAADIVAVIVFAAVGRAGHGESGEVLGLLATAAPFAIGVGAAWATPVVRVQPAGLRAGAVVLAGAVVIGLALRAGFTGQLPPSFAVVTTMSLAVLLLGWRALSLAVAHRVGQRVR